MEFGIVYCHRVEAVISVVHELETIERFGFRLSVYHAQIPVCVELCLDECLVNDGLCFHVYDCFFAVNLSAQIRGSRNFRISIGKRPFDVGKFAFVLMEKP